MFRDDKGQPGKAPDGLSARTGSPTLKRLFDIVVAAAALVVFAIPMVAVAVVVFLSDRGPIFFRQTRVGLNCVPFLMFKFRSMVLDADQLGGYATTTGDSRITPVGRLIRRTSLDELPQLFNVLRGDMSIVGPRPDVPEQRPLYAPEQWRARHSVRPGITGLAQAVARSAASADTRTQLDLQYVESASVIFDLKIILMTIRRLGARIGN